MLNLTSLVASIQIKYLQFVSISLSNILKASKWRGMICLATAVGGDFANNKA